MIYVENMEEEPLEAERLALQQMSGNGSKLHHDNEDDEAKEVGQRRRIVIRKNTLLPHNQPHYYQSRKASSGGQRKGSSSTVLRRFDANAVNSRSSQDLDLENMVKGVSSVSSQVQDPDNVCSPRFDKAAGAEGQSSTKKRLTYGGQWLQKKCWWCLHRLRNWRNRGARPRRDSVLDDSLEERRQYWGPLIAAKGGAGPSAKPLFSKFKAEGHVTSACLWHACRAVTFGSLLIIMGITMAVLGFISDQKVYEDRLKNETHPIQKKNGPGLAEPVERFGLNNLSFAGPVIMGVGGFLIVAACVMTFEARDNAAKVVPATTENTVQEENQRTSLKGADVLAWKAFSSLANPAAASDSTSKEPSRLTFSPENNHQPTGQPSSYNLPLQAQFTSSSSQTTFLDRNIVQNLAVSSTVPVFTAAAIATSSSKLSSIGRTVTTTATNACTRRRRPRTVPASYTSGSGGSCKRASSFSGTLPEVAGIEPGLALMDEIGRRALTDAFIRFTKETAKTHRFLYNPKEGDPHLGSPIENNIENCEEGQNNGAGNVKKGLDCHMEEDLEDEDLQSPGMAKCPSAPNIHQHKLYQPVPSMLVTPAASNAAAAAAEAAKGNASCHQNIQLDHHIGKTTKKRHQSILRSDSSPNSKSSSASRVKLSLSPLPPTFENQSSMYSYRVLTPTMYRSRMATARQAVSMDYDDDSGAVKKARLRREGPAMRGPSPLLRPGKLLRAQRSSGENSFDLELGASATRVHQLPQANAKYKRLSPNVHQQLSAEHSGSSMMLDLHIEGAAPVTLLVRDESRSTRSTSFNREEDELSSSSPTRPLHGSSEETAEDVGGPEGGQNSTKNQKIKKVSSLALQIVDSDSGEPLTLAEEIASFEFIDELASDVTSGSSFSDLADVWSPDEAKTTTTHVSLKSKFLTHLEKNLLSIPARRASAESLSSPNQSDKPSNTSSINQEKTIKTSVSVTTELNRIPQMQRNVATRQSKLVRQKKVDLK